VTTGTYGSNPMTSTFVGYSMYKTWNGSNGKLQSYAGGKRLKWNNYTCTIANRIRPSRAVQTLVKGSPDAWFPFNTSISTSGFGTDLVWTSQDTLRLQSRLLQKVKGHDFQLAVNLAQLNQVSSMVAFNLGQLGRAIMALKRGDFATAARSLGTKPRASRLKATDIGGRWLELQYGWLPTLSDTFEAVKAFHKISEGPRSKLFRTSVKKQGEIEGSHSPSLYSAKYTSVLQTYLMYEMYEEMSIYRQLGLTDPASVMWELIPYSFVVDWFVPIGTYLDNLNAIPKLKGRFLTTTVRRRWGFHELNFNGLVDPPPNTSGDIIAVDATAYKDVFNQIVVNRVFSDQLEVPYPRFDLRGAVHGRRVWNAISLAQMRFGKGKTARRSNPFKSSLKTGRIKTFRGSTLI
jgi:hypothetical protein